MKKIIKFICFFISLCIFATCVTACGGTTEKVDTSKSQLYIGNYNTGYGTAWINALKARFEEDYKDYSFEEGKKGIQVFIDETVSGVDIASTLPGSRSEIFFTESVDYYNLYNLGLLKNIDKWVTADLTEYGENKSIEDKMDENSIEYFKTANGYYGLPFHATCHNIAYDRDLFDEYNLYFAADTSEETYPAAYTESNGKKIYKFINSNQLVKSAGVDGKIGTYDDGLPATFEQFFYLCDRLVANGIIPITWAGQYQLYFTELLMSLYANLEGVEQANLLYNFSGTADDIVTSIAGDGTVSTKSLEITEENAYELMQQKGRYDALDFADRLISNSDYYDATKCFSKAQTHKDAQNTFLLGRFSDNVERTAMLIDGVYWINEASGTFSSMEMKYGEQASASSRKIGFMPLPFASDDQIGQKYTFTDNLYGACFVNANVSDSRMNIIGEFLKYCHSNESLINFTQVTSAIKPFDYDIDANSEEYQNLTYYAQNLIEVINSSDIFYGKSNNVLFLDNISALRTVNGAIWNSTTNGMLYATPSTAINDGISGVDYFNGLANTFTKTYWEKSILRK